MKATLWARFRMFVDSHAAKIAVAVVVGGAIAMGAGLRWEATTRADAIEAEAKHRAVQIEAAAAERRDEVCEALDKGQRIDRALIATVLDGGNGGVPLLDVPAYQGLPPNVQLYVQQLAAGTPGAEPGDTLAERLAAFRDEFLGPDDLPAYCTPDQ